MSNFGRPSARPAKRASTLRKHKPASAPPEAAADTAEAPAKAGHHTVLARVAVGAVFGLCAVVASSASTRKAELASAATSMPVALASTVEGCQVPKIRRFWFGGDIDVQADLPYVISSGVAHYERLAAFTLCISTNETGRLCQPEARKALAADLKVYSELRNEVADFAAAVRRARTNMMTVSVAAEISDAAKQFDAIPARDADVMTAVADLGRESLISLADFGRFGRGMPEAIKGALTAVSVRSNACGG